MKKFFREFKEFISKGNVFDMAVGLIIATAFNKIVSSMVNDLLMPLVTWGTGANSVADLSIVLKETINEDGSITKLTWNYGNFAQTVIDFFIVALSVFIMVKVVNNSRKKFENVNNFISEGSKKEIRKEFNEGWKNAKAEGKSKIQYFKEFKEKKAEEAKKLEEEKKEAEKQKALEERKNNPTESDLLKEIRDLLKEKNEG